MVQIPSMAGAVYLAALGSSFRCSGIGDQLVGRGDRLELGGDLVIGLRARAADLDQAWPSASSNSRCRQD
jgi:hypothetical protein